MIIYSFKMIWRRRRQHLFPWLGLFLLSTICGFYLFIFHEVFLPYFTDLGWDEENVVSCWIPWDQKDSPSFFHTSQNLYKEMGQMSQVEAVCQTYKYRPAFDGGFFSFGWEISNNKDPQIHFGVAKVDSTFTKVFPMKGFRGRWLSEDDKHKKIIPAVLSESLLERMGHSKPFLDKRLKIVTGGKDTMELQVVGTMLIFRVGGNERDEMLFIPLDEKPNVCVFRLKDGVDLEDFQRDLKQVMLRYLPPKALDNLRVCSVENYSKMIFDGDSPSLYGTAAIVLLVLINAIVGLVALFWEKARKRAHELALRRAVGAPRKTIFREVYGEALVLTLLAIIPGLALTFQIPLLVNQEWETWIYSSLEAVGFLLFVIFWCSYFPARKASRILPAQALMEE